MPNVPSLIISTCHFYLLASAFVSVSPRLRELLPEGTSNHLEPAGQANLCWRFSHHHVLSIWKDRPLNLIKFHLSPTLSFTDEVQNTGNSHKSPAWSSITLEYDLAFSQQLKVQLHYPQVWRRTHLSIKSKATCYFVIQRVRKNLYSKFYWI